MRALFIGLLFACVTTAVAPTAMCAESDEVAAFRAFMASRHDQAFEIVRRTFPDEFGDVEKRVAHEYALTHDQTAALLALRAFAVQIQQKYFYQIGQAPDEDLQAIGAAKLAQYRMLQRVDPVACYEMAERGSIEPDRAAKLMGMKRDPGADTGTPQLIALMDARQHPVTRGPLSQEDMKVILGEYVRLGGSMTYFKSLQSDSEEASLSADERCNDIILLNEAVKDSPKEIAARFWAQAYLALRASH